MKQTALIIVALIVLLFACLPAWADEQPAEVQATVTAVERHNTTVENADAALERAIARAQAEHTRNVIAAKERLLADLRRALRAAINGDTPENAIAIQAQIEFVQGQIDALRAPQQQAEEQQEEAIDFSPMAGTWRLTFPNGHTRTITIDNDGQCRVDADKNGGRDGVDVGQTYQGEAVNGWYAVHFTEWTTGPAQYSDGRMIFLRLQGDNVLVRLADTNLETTGTPASAPTRWTQSQNTRTPLEEPEPEEEQEEESTDPDAPDFFGTPLR